MISRQEELILLAVWRLKDKAYGMTIRKHLEKITGKKYSVGAIYVPLDRLAHKGYLRAYHGEPTPERGGMAKRYYEVTPAGIEALKEAKKLHDTAWDNTEGLKFI